ncbi:PREDICTED: centrosomal protein of 89 kDa [Nanorana parkeri]|uniref:centrosomal protein of 89 kDa n=1 Tax=Nanorana parkeri TaxID=125878 RepID=UPI0008544868|nr:PREDICTED: centrosomal protein of 89 kDa [Nanorana parkeri]
MSFPFRRREANQFKHIAHGLIPAATVAPRSAVPRTPPPRSPNPSPERPRSALAAAILMTSLTGRTVAIPQPRQRSYSETDSMCVDRTSQIEPYASASELGIAQNWKDYANRKKQRSPVMSSQYDDDDGTEEQMSEIEKQFVQQASPRRDENVAAEPIYALPHKGRKRPTASPEQEEIDGSGATSSDMDNYQAFSDHSPGEESRVDPAAESPIPEPDPTARRSRVTEVVRSGSTNLLEAVTPTGASEAVGRPAVSEAVSHHGVSEAKGRPGVSEAANHCGVLEAGTRGSHEVNQEEIRQLHTANQQLTNKNHELSIQVEEMKQQMKAWRLKMKNLKNEKELEEAWKTSHMGADAAELVSLQQQAQELVDENDALKMTIHRLNVELSRYQTKYRPLTKEENLKIGGLPPKGPPPPWLLDMKYLSPLLLAYEDRLKEKDHLILSFEEEITNFKRRVKQVIEENERLHQVLEQERPVNSKEWEMLQSQNKLLSEENTVLVEKLEVQEMKSRESHAKHLQEVSQLTKQLMTLEATNRSSEEALLETQKQQELLRSKYSELKANMDGSVAAEEHVAMVNELKSQLRQQQDTSEKEAREMMDKSRDLQSQKKTLLLQKNDLVDDNKILEAELEAVRKSNRKMKRRVGQLRQQLEDSMEKEVTAHQYLANLITLAENITGERDQLIHVAKGLEAEKHGVLSKMMEGSVRLGRLEEMVKVYKKKAATTVRGITHTLTEQEEDFAGKAARYQREMKHLHWLLQDRQETLNEALQQKKRVEGELEVIWESASNENRQLKGLLHDTLKQTKHIASHSSPGFQHHSAVGFSYCEVNSFSHQDEPAS